MVNLSFLEMPSEQYLFRVGVILFAITNIIQVVEFFRIRLSWSEAGVWSAQLISKEWQERPLAFWEKPLAGLFFKHPWFWQQGFVILLALKFIAALSLLFSTNPWALAIVWLSCVLINLRWRGTYNGGSDMMSLVVASGLLVSKIVHPTAGLLYIGVQSTLSYFIAGVIKIQKKDWRSGKALAAFLQNSVFDSPHPHVEKIYANRNIILILTWLTLAFECLFPLALLNVGTTVLFIAIAAIFHFSNIYIFGLNRFFWAWASSWPGVLLLALQIQKLNL